MIISCPIHLWLEFSPLTGKRENLHKSIWWKNMHIIPRQIQNRRATNLSFVLHIPVCIYPILDIIRTFLQILSRFTLILMPVITYKNLMNFKFHFIKIHFNSFMWIIYIIFLNETHSKFLALYFSSTDHAIGFTQVTIANLGNKIY